MSEPDATGCYHEPIHKEVGKSKLVKVKRVRKAMNFQTDAETLMALGFRVEREDSYVYVDNKGYIMTKGYTLGHLYYLPDWV
jgi:hypothetical protein